MSLVFARNPQYEFELMRVMGQTPYGAAEIGECLATARRVVEGDDDSWYREWTATAEWVLARGEEALAGGHRVSARDAFLRAANYFRTSEFFLHGDPADPRIRTSAARGVQAFRAAARLFDPPAQVLQIPYEGVPLPGYFFSCGADEPRPVLVAHNGFDGTGEEIWSMLGRAGLERGLPADGWGEIYLEESTPHAGSHWTNDGRPRDRRQLKNRERGEGRTVPCPPELTALLHAHVAEFGTGPDGRLFVGERADELPKLTYMRVWRAARKATFTPEVLAGPLGATPYSLRHACVSTWLNGGVPAPQVAEWAGHSVEMLLRVYAKCIDGQDEALRRRVMEALGHREG